MGVIRTAVTLAFCSGALFGAAVLRLSNTAVAFRSAVVGQKQTIEAYNGGDGSLAVGVSAPKASPWLRVSVSVPGPCTMTKAAGSCVPIEFSIAADLPAQTSSAQVVVFSPGAVDSPQTVVVVAATDDSGAVNRVDAVMAPGTRQDFLSGSVVGLFTPPTTGSTTNDGGTWLSLAMQHLGTIGGPTYFYIHLTPPLGIGPGTHYGDTSVTGSGLDKQIPVAMHVESPPLAIPSPARLNITVAEGGTATSYPFAPPISLEPTGAIRAKAVTASGAGVSAVVAEGLTFVTIDPARLKAGDYGGSLTIGCDAANCPVVVPVAFRVLGKGPPVLDHISQTDSDLARSAVAPGDVAVIHGSQLSLVAPQVASAPLPTSLGGAEVLVNGAPVPLYYSSLEQIAFQVPFTLPATFNLQVRRDGELSAAQTFGSLITSADIVAVTNADYEVRDSFHPTHAGEVLILWCTGLGAVDRAVDAGAASPADPPANARFRPPVRFGPSVQATPDFAGLSPGAVGLYQVNVVVPAGAPKGNIFLRLADSGTAAPVTVD